jgi:putative transcriptional regulator
MKEDFFDELMESVQEMDEIVKGKKKAARITEYPAPAVREIRERLNYTQESFAAVLGVSKRTLQNWEQGRRQPTGAARSLLKIAEYNPEVVKAALVS